METEDDELRSLPPIPKEKQERLEQMIETMLESEDADMTDEKKTCTIFNNDYTEYCESIAKDYQEYMQEFLPDFPAEDFDERELLSNLGMEDAELDDFMDQAREKDAADAYDMLAKKIHELSKDSPIEQSVVQNFFEDKAMEDPRGLFHSMQEDNIHEDLRQDYENFLHLNLDEPHLCFGADMGWRNLSGHQIFQPEEDIATSLIQSENTDTTLEIRYTEGDPCLRATAYTHDSPMGESFSIIPASWARAAYQSEEFHDRLSGLLTRDDDVKYFLYEAEAIPELERDPITYGIVNGMIDYATPFLSNSKEAWEEQYHLAATKIAKFDLDDFKQYCEKAYLDFHCNPNAPYVTAEGVKDAVYTCLAELEPVEDSALTLGIDTILGEKPDTIHEKLGAFIHGDTAVTKELEALGHERMPVSSELNLDDLTNPETKDVAIQVMTDYFVKKGMDVDAIDNLLSEVKMGAISKAETMTKAKGEVR